MRMGQGVRTGLGHGASPVSYRHNFLVSGLKVHWSNFVNHISDNVGKK